MVRRQRQAVSPFVIILLIAAVIVTVWWLSRGNQSGPDDTQPAPPEGSVHLAMGNPSNATADTSHPDNYLMVKDYFALSYNNTKGTPNWVSWCLKDGDVGHESGRRPPFYPDGSLPSGFMQVKPTDYTGSGFDRGHMCPYGDRSSTEEASKAVFAMTNIIPQSHPCNEKAWNDLEKYCRNLVKKEHQALYIVAGPQGQGGVGKKGEQEVRADTIGHAEKVTVPAKCWKVVLALPGGHGDVADVNRVNHGGRLIAVVMPNDQSVGPRWPKYRTSVKEVEKLTGYHFFDRVPAAIIEPLKEQVDRE